MKILIISATTFEVSKTIKHFQDFNKSNIPIDFLETGIGQLHCCFALTQKLQTTEYDIVIQAGICGSVSKQYQLGEIIHITEDEIIDVGATSETDFIPLKKLDVSKNKAFTQDTVFLPNKTINTKLLGSTKKGKGITSNTAHGDLFWVNYLNKNHPNAFESMEGATSFFVCNQMNTPVIQIRSISNYVEIRDITKWKIEKSIFNLNQFLIQLINEI